MTSTFGRSGRLLSPRDREKLAALAKMKLIATVILVVMGVIFVVSFALQSRYPGLGYVRAASEGGMVGGIADWFAVTALFRYPLGVKIPHTAIIPNRKNEIGRTLAEFVESNFLSREVVVRRLRALGISRTLGTWLSTPANADRVTAEAAAAAGGLLRMLDDAAMREVIESIARRQLLEPEWGPALGRAGAKFLDSGQHVALIDSLVQRVGGWLEDNPQIFGNAVASRMPSWIPSFLSGVIDDTAYREAKRFIDGVRDDPNHTVRLSLDAYLHELTQDLQNKPETIAKVEALKRRAFDDPQIQSLTARVWDTARNALAASLIDPESELRRRVGRIITEFGMSLSTDAALAAKVDAWVEDAAVYLLETHSQDITAVISDTVAGWDPGETSEKLEAEVGRDLQFIRINGTVVGSLAGLVIFSVVTAIFPG